MQKVLRNLKLLPNCLYINGNWQKPNPVPPFKNGTWFHHLKTEPGSTIQKPNLVPPFKDENIKTCDVAL